jgi:serine/threonine protein kinase
MGDGERHKSSVFGDYDLFETLGQGGIGEAYVARSRRGEHADTFVCLKIMGREFQAASGARRREAIDSLRHEARVVSQLHHPNIARLLDSGAYNDVWFLAFELIEGATLGEVLAMQPLGRGMAPNHARRIGLEVAAALQCAHDHDVLHRDIKPNNILVGMDGQVKLVDFGLAKANARNAADFTVGVGTPRYWAPEQIREEALGPSTDIYALGVVLYELLATVHPFHDNDPAEFRKNVLRGVPQHNLREFGVPDDLAAIVERCLHTDPGQRFESAAALQTALRCGAKASGFEYDIGEIASAARELSAETRVIASDESLRYESGHKGATVIADVHRRETLFETPQALADEIREAIPGSMSNHVRDQVMEDLSLLAKQARERRHSHTARRRDSSTTEEPSTLGAQAVTPRQRGATVLEVQEPATTVYGSPEPPTASYGTAEPLPTPARRRSRKTIRGFSQPGSTELKSDPPPPSTPPSETPARAATIAVTSRRRVGWSAVALVGTCLAVAAVFALAPSHPTSKRTAHAPSQTERAQTSPPPVLERHEPAPTPMQPVEQPSAPPPAELPAAPLPTAAAIHVATDGAAHPTTKRAATAKPAEPKGPLVQVTVGLIPYGNVSIDGKRAGVAPVIAKLALGPHLIVGRNPEFRDERTVVVTPDVHTVVLDLRDGKPSH